MNPRLVVIGSSNTDMVVKVPRLPAPGETVLGGEFVMAPGGKGANQAVAAARLGAQVHFVARVGNDLFGEGALANLGRAGINTDFVVRDEAPSGVALIFVDEHGENCIAVASGANMALSPADVEAARPAIAQAHVMVLQLEVPMETVAAAVRLANDCGVKVLLNPAPAQPLPDVLLRHVDVLTPNGHELTQLTEASGTLVENARSLIARGVKTVIVTVSSQGSVIVTPTTTERVPACEAQVVDTTAAGDCFTGALAVAMAEALEITEGVRFASAAAAISVTRMGAQPSMPTRAEVEELLNGS